MKEDEVIKNEYNLPITRQCLEGYMELLINKIFKLLPTFEGKSSLNHQIIYTPEQAYKHFQSHLEEVILEVTGNYYLYNNSPKILELLTLLDGLRDVTLEDHQTVRTIVFKCTNICMELKETLNDEDK